MTDRGGRRELDTERLKTTDPRENDIEGEGSKEESEGTEGQDTEGASETVIERSREITRQRKGKEHVEIDREMGY